MAKISFIAGLGLGGLPVPMVSSYSGSLQQTYEERPIQTYGVVNGHRSGGQKLSKGIWYSLHNTLTRSQPKLVENTDLIGGCMMPPFVEAHLHRKGNWRKEIGGNLLSPLHKKICGQNLP